jgi:hypothetical protein
VIVTIFKEIIDLIYNEKKKKKKKEVLQQELMKKKIKLHFTDFLLN